MDEENLQTFVHILGLLDGLKASLAQSMHALSVVTSMTDLSEQISLEAFGEGSVPMTLTRYPTLAGARSRISRLATSTKTTFSPNIGSEQLSADLEPVGAFASGTATSAGSPRTKPRAAFDVKGSDLLKNLIENASSESLGGKDVSASHDSDILSVMWVLL
ncbi:MAG: hypothetical protein KVP17_003101 [Porospora cf. gigantea B]|uniref:uncharacterized protein n=1 Tax=Porospora cf. gigantea B TaxID=2853592 RepID=UPI0035719E42|nr:MAG: hypothetical protein KVP17_003101 [Porospora cf. gigantea B]